MSGPWIVFTVVVFVLCVVFGPISVIWALNTLFHLGLPYNVQTWAAVLILSATLSMPSMPYGRRK